MQSRMSCKESAIILFSNDVVNEMTLAKKYICNVVVCFVFHDFFLFRTIFVFVDFARVERCMERKLAGQCHWGCPFKQQNPFCIEELCSFPQ